MNREVERRTKALDEKLLELEEEVSFLKEFDDDDLVADKNKLFRCLAELREPDLQLMELRYFEKRSYREIGEILDVTENNAKVKTFRALERLKKQFLK